MMFCYDATGDEQTQATPAAVRTLLAADKWLEYPLHIGLGDARAIVADFNRGRVLVLTNAHLDRAILYRVFDCIVYEVAHCLNDTVTVRVKDNGGIGMFVDETPLAHRRSELVN